MSEITTPSAKKKMTAGQIDKATANFRAMLEKHAPEFDAEAVQTVLGMPDLAGKMFGLFRQLVETVANMIVRLVKVNRTRTAEEAIKATGRNFYGDWKVVRTMPRGEGEEVEICFFKVGWYINDADLEKEYESRGLSPVDPYSLAAVNEADQTFADQYPNGTHWQDADGNWCYAAFSRYHGERRVNVSRDSNDWHGHWWFAGVRKP